MVHPLVALNPAHVLTENTYHSCRRATLTHPDFLGGKFRDESRTSVLSAPTHVAGGMNSRGHITVINSTGSVFAYDCITGSSLYVIAMQSDLNQTYNMVMDDQDNIYISGYNPSQVLVYSANV